MNETPERLTLSAVNARIEGHEDLCGERYKNIAAEMVGIRADLKSTREAHKESFQEIKGILKWVAGLAFTLLMSVAGWGLSQQFSAIQAGRSTDKAQLDAERSAIQLMQSQMNTFAASVKGAPTTVNVQPVTQPGIGPSDPAATPPS